MRGQRRVTGQPTSSGPGKVITQGAWAHHDGGVVPVCPQCRREVRGLDREVSFGLPDEVFALASDDRTKRVVQLGKSFVLLDGKRCFLRVLLPVNLDVPHEFRFGVWVEIDQKDFKRVWDVWDDPAYAGTSVEGWLANAVPLWGKSVLGAACHASARDAANALFIDRSSNQILSSILETPWPIHECQQLIQRVWGD